MVDVLFTLLALVALGALGLASVAVIIEDETPVLPRRGRRPG